MYQKGKREKKNLSKDINRILIADDSEMNRAMLAEMLGKEYEILEAVNGEV